MMLQPNEPWLPCTMNAVEQYLARSPAIYARVLDQFRVADHPRYAPKSGCTYCNIYVWDVTSAMGCEVPHWVDAGFAPSAPGKGFETVANQLVDMLSAGAWGWMATTEPIECANRGRPVIAGWKNPHGPGHLAMVRPHCVNGRIVVAQAGRVCAERLSLRSAFGARHVTFWTHP